MLDDCSIEIFGSEKSVSFCAKLLDLFHLRSEKIKCRVAFNPVGDGETYPLYPGLSCTFHKVPHSPSSMAVGFHLSEEAAGLLYSGDTPRNPELLQKTKDLDLLIHDCSAPSRFFKKYPSLHSMHTDSLTLGEMAQEAGVMHLIPCHFFGELEYSLGEIEKEIRENYGGKLTIPEDFSRIPIRCLERRPK
jgi:ribonuclease BN (tRNA processing enzyme)